MDTHGRPVGAVAWDLLATAYDRLGPVPTLLERDFNFPPLDELLEETDRIRALQEHARSVFGDAAAERSARQVAYG